MLIVRQLGGRFTHWLLISTCPVRQLDAIVRMQSTLFQVKPRLHCEQTLLLKSQTWQLAELLGCTQVLLNAKQPILQLQQDWFRVLKLVHPTGIPVQLLRVVEKQKPIPQLISIQLPFDKTQALETHAVQEPLALAAEQLLGMHNVLKSLVPGAQKVMLLGMHCPFTTVKLVSAQVQQLPVQGSKSPQLLLTGQQKPNLQYSLGLQLVDIVQAPFLRVQPERQERQVRVTKSQLVQGSPLEEAPELEVQPMNTALQSAKLELKGHAYGELQKLTVAETTTAVWKASPQYPLASPFNLQVLTPLIVVEAIGEVLDITENWVPAFMTSRVTDDPLLGDIVTVTFPLSDGLTQKYLNTLCLSTSVSLRIATLFTVADRQYIVIELKPAEAVVT